MPGEHTVHCGICGKAISGSNFYVRMKKLREHRKREHPKAHKRSVKKSQKSRKSHDPVKKRAEIMAMPQVLTYHDYWGRRDNPGLLRVLERADGKNFPEFALYVAKFEPLIKSLKDAGFTDEGRGKWVLRTNKFNIFVYV